MSPLPTQLRNRWADRAEPAAGEGTIYWHMLVGDHPEVREVARAAQASIGDVSGFHLTPLQWLHMTTLVVGSTNDVTHVQMTEMVSLANQELATTPPITVQLGRVLYHPEAIMLGTRPEGALAPILRATQTATRTVLGRDGQINSGTSWTPHMTLLYSTADQPAEPVISALGKEVAGCELTIDRVTLVIQHGAERLWDWQPVGAAHLQGQPATSHASEP